MPREINRAALVVRPRRPYLEWAASLDNDAPVHAQGLKKRVSVYLLAEDPEGEKETAPIKDYYKEIFELELAAWSEDKTQWPRSRSLDAFHEWFDVVGESIVTDLESGPIKAEQADIKTEKVFQTVKNRFSKSLKNLAE